MLSVADFFGKGSTEIIPTFTSAEVAMEDNKDGEATGFSTGGEVGLRVGASGTIPPEINALPPCCLRCHQSIPF